jgi:hypothetical protein
VSAQTGEDHHRGRRAAVAGADAGRVELRDCANLGRQVGGNLFHSFGAFGLNRGGMVTFGGPALVANVTSVTLSVRR